MRAMRYALAWLVCAAALAMVGCTPALTKARMSVTAAAQLGSTAADLFGAVDAQEQQAIAAAVVKDHDVAKAEKARDEWRSKQGTAIKALKVYNTTVSGLGALAELQAQNGKLDLGQLLSQLANTYAQLVDVLKAFGVTLPRGI